MPEWIRFAADLESVRLSQERILDLGCGSGELTLSALLPAVQPNGSVVGFDASPDLLAKARTNAASSPLSNEATVPVTWIEGDGHDLEKSGEKEAFDAVFSNAALHWMKRDPAQVVRGVYGLLKPGGRFVGEVCGEESRTLSRERDQKLMPGTETKQMGGAMNMIGVRSVLHTVLGEYGVDAAAVDPWFFPTPAQYSAILQAAGFGVESCGTGQRALSRVRANTDSQLALTELIPRPTPLPESGLAGWLDTFAFAFLDALPATVDREQVKAEVCRRLEVDMKHGEQWTTMYVRLRFKARKE